jgi:hypothetical protein
MIGREAIRRLRGPSVRIQKGILEHGSLNIPKTKLLSSAEFDGIRRPVLGLDGNSSPWVIKKFLF